MIALAAMGARSARNALALLLAMAGVYAVTDVRLALAPLGLALAFANAALFALYIVLAHRAAAAGASAGVEGLGAAMLIAAVAVTPIGGPAAAGALGNPVALLAGAGVGCVIARVALHRGPDTTADPFTRRGRWSMFGRATQ